MVGSRWRTWVSWLSFAAAFVLVGCESAQQVARITVVASAGPGGAIAPISVDVAAGAVATFQVTAAPGFEVASVTGCGGALAAATYTTAPVQSACEVVAEFVAEAAPSPDAPLPGAPQLTWEPRSGRTFAFAWEPVADASIYRLLEDPDGASGLALVAEFAGSATDAELEVFLPSRISAQYVLEACNDAGCTASDAVAVTGDLVESIGYFKASNTGVNDLAGASQLFGFSVALSENGRTMAVGAFGEGSGATGIDGDQTDRSLVRAGAVYVFVRDDAGWRQQAYVKASNTHDRMQFGISVALSADGDTLAVGASLEDHGATGVDRPPGAADAPDSGAVYVFARSGDTWAQQAYVKPSDTKEGQRFGFSVALSDGGETLAVGAPFTAAVGRSGEALLDAGAVYLFGRDGAGFWGQVALVRARNVEEGAEFGHAVDLAANGAWLAVGAHRESSAAVGVDGDPAKGVAATSGAGYLFERSGDVWRQEAYLKASNSHPGARFGSAVSLSSDGLTLAVGAVFAGGDHAGVVGGQAPTTDATYSGAVYVYVRDAGRWEEGAYVKADDPISQLYFGWSAALSGDGNRLAVGAWGHRSLQRGVASEPSGLVQSTDVGAAYVYRRTAKGWVPEAHLKAPNSAGFTYFGASVALAGDGATLAVGAENERGSATGVDGDQDVTTNPVPGAGAVYLY